MGYKASALSGRRGGVAIASGCCPGLGASALSGRVGQAWKWDCRIAFRTWNAAESLRKNHLHENCVKFIKKIHGNDGDYKIIVTFAIE